MTIHDEIKALLDRGEIVYSFALGRVGQIMSVDNHPSGFVIEICPKSRTHNDITRHRHPHGATTFVVGDDVELQKKQDASGRDIWAVINKDL